MYGLIFNITAHLAINLFVGWIWYRHGYKMGVLHGYMVGKFPEATYKRGLYPKALKVVDELEAAVAWKTAQEEARNGLETDL